MKISHLSFAINQLFNQWSLANNWQLETENLLRIEKWQLAIASKGGARG